MNDKVVLHNAQKLLKQGQIEVGETPCFSAKRIN
jgi:hypothetical protein